MKPGIHDKQYYNYKIWKKSPQSSKEFRDFCCNQMKKNKGKGLGEKRKEAKKAERKANHQELIRMARKRNKDKGHSEERALEFGLQTY